MVGIHAQFAAARSGRIASLRSPTAASPSHPTAAAPRRLHSPRGGQWLGKLLEAYTSPSEPVSRSRRWRMLV